MSDIYHSSNISVVVDNNVLVDLYELNCLSLLFQVFDSVTIPKPIYEDELIKDIKVLIADYDFILGSINSIVGLETYGLLVQDQTYKRLSKYDRFAISIAKENHYYCSSNDKPVRRACIKLGVKVTGILGVLGRAYIKKIITKTQLSKHLDDLISDKTSCYIAVELIDQLKEYLFE